MNEHKTFDSWGIRFAGIEFFYWMALACYNYLTVFLESKGYSQVQVGIINTLASIIAVFSSPIGGTIADKLQSSRKALMIYTSGLAIVYFLIPISSEIKLFGISLMLIFIVLAQFFRAPTQSLLETTVINGCNKNGNDYGKVRVFGTISYVIISIALGMKITTQNAHIPFYLLSLLILPLLFILNQVGSFDWNSDTKKTVSLRNLPYGKLLKNPYFIAYFIFNLFNYIPQMASMSFQPYILKAVGGNMGFIGFIQAYRACFEIPTLLLANKIEKKISYKNMVIFSAVFMAIQALIYSRVTSFSQILIATTFAGIASGFSIAGAFKYIFTLAPKQLISTAQTLVATTSSIAGIIGNIIGTMLIERIGVKNLFGVMGLIILINVVNYTIILMFINKKYKDFNIKDSKENKEN